VALIRPFDLQFFSQEKTEPATPRKRRKTREDGKTAKSQDLGAAVVILAGLLFLRVFVGPFGESMKGHLVTMLRAAGDRAFLAEGWAWLLGVEALKDYLIIWLPLGLSCAVVALAITVYQVGFFITAKPLELKLDRLNPLSGLKRIVSLRSLVELCKGLLKAFLFMALLYYALRKDLKRLVAVIALPLDEGTAEVIEAVWYLGLRFALLLLTIALFDYLYQRWEFERSIKMSKQEIKDEYKQMEGDPQIKRRIRQKQRELARGRMMQDVPKADVVITNPTTLAVALRYDRQTMEAPQVVAKGKGVIARNIREVAVESDVPIVENKVLARALYSQVEIGEEVPEDLYRAVAEVLAFVYRIRTGRRPVRPSG
jgi:flagellar biosynthetic protein FlhB